MNAIGDHHDLCAMKTAQRDELLDDLLAWIKAADAPLAMKK
jgi:hypothetical protein